MRKAICLVLATVFFSAATLDARSNKSRAVSSSQSPTERETAIKKKLIEVPPGTMIEVRLLNKQKIRGRLGQVDDQGLTLTTAQEGKIVTQKIAFNEVNSFKNVEPGKGGHKVVWMLAGIGVLVGICAIIAAIQVL